MRWLQRSVGLAIIGAAALGAAALWVGVASGDPEARRSPREGVLFGIWRVFYDSEMPAPRVMLAAVGLLRRTGAIVEHAGFVIDLFDLGGADKLRALGVNIQSLVPFPGH